MPDPSSVSLASAIALAFAVYASTNIDDLLLLAVFFADPRVRIGAVIAGRYVGLAVLVIGSAAAALLALAVPREWVALLGLVPLFLGLRQLFHLLWTRDKSSDGDGAVAATGERPHAFMSQTLTVAGVTLANGGDNFGVYIPFFAVAPRAITTYVAVFLLMTAAWCALGYAVVNNRLLGRHIRRFGPALLPAVLIPLGLYILAGALPLLR